MKLCSLIKNINCRVLGNPVVEISGLYHQDTCVKENGLFFCLHGAKVDGSTYVFSAVKNGAVAVVSEQEIVGLGCTQIIVKNARETMSLLSCKFYGNPADKLKIVAVTGTNGKTTITSMIAYVLEKAGKKCGIIGTNGVKFLDKIYDTGMTTPDPIELQRYLSLMVKNRIEYVVMEVSAHALYLQKVAGMTFKATVFSNLSEDHLDFFKTMENYFQAKAKLFSRRYTDFAVVCIDDEYGKRLAQSINFGLKTYAKSGVADLTISSLKENKIGQTVWLSSGKNFDLNLSGEFNVLNLMASILVLEHLGIQEDFSIRTLKTMNAVDGRFNVFYSNGIKIVIDYAHTPDGLENVLKVCRGKTCSGKVISIFGCGGNREKQKRAVMGEISSRYADLTIITSDNPRFEDREKIASDIESGITSGSKYFVELDRSVAIEKGLGLAKSGDVVLIAGKGSENYIDENGIKIPYSDFDEIKKYIKSDVDNA